MKKKLLVKNILVATGLTALMAVPMVAFGQDAIGDGLGSVSSVFPHGGLSGTTSVMGLIRTIIQLMLMFAGIVAVIFIIIGGYMYITSSGNAEQAEKGKNTLVNAIIGIIIIVLSYVVVTVITNLVGQGNL